MNKRIVITGIGVVSSIGIGREEFSTSLQKGSSGEKKITLFDVQDNAYGTAFQIEPFEYHTILGDIKSRYLDRSTLLGLAAMKLALDDGKLTEEQQKNLGVIVGSALASIRSIAEYTEDIFTKGPMDTNPMKFPNTVMNSPTSQINIRYGQTAFSTTITNGSTASLDAIAYGMNHLRMGHAKSVAVGGIEELSPEAFEGNYLIGCLAPQGKSIPFDVSSQGAKMGEAGVVLIMEELSHAQDRKAPILAEVKGYGFSFDPRMKEMRHISRKGSERAMLNALNSAGMEAKDIDLIYANANGNPHSDKIEMDSVQSITGNRHSPPYLASIKSLVGECYGASGALQVAAAIASLNKHFVPGNQNLKSSWNPSLSHTMPTTTVETDVNAVLLNSFSPSGFNSSLIISKF